MKFAQIADMHFGGEAGVPALLEVSEAAADELIGLVDGAVEQHVVIGHVEMAVVVDPGGLDPHDRGHERGGKDRRGLRAARCISLPTATNRKTAAWAASDP